MVALGSEPISLDPQDASDGISLHATELIFDKLVTFDKDMKIVPELAKEWSSSEDGKAWTFTLVEGAKFQDGTPVNAEAVKASFDRILDKNNKLKRRSLFAERQKPEAISLPRPVQVDADALSPAPSTHHSHGPFAKADAAQQRRILHAL